VTVPGDTAAEQLVVISERVAEPDTDQPGRVLRDLGSLPALLLSAALGLAICAQGDALSRSTESSSQVLFWVGVLTILVPIVFRLTGRQAMRGERVALILVLGVALYLVKVMHSPFGFTYGDEFIHIHNVDEIIGTHHLFGGNSVLPITARYPGLESVAAALSELSGIGSFAAGLIVIGVARVIMMLALFLLFERLSGSYRVAALGAAVYVANSNFVFFSAQFSYESLALPLLVLVIACVLAWEACERGRGRAWVLPIMLLTAAIAVTHHLSSYALAGILTLLAVVSLLFRRRTGRSGPWPYALFAIAAVAAWLIVVASQTVGYLSPVITNAFTNTLNTLSGEAAPRTLFAPASSGYQVAPLERVVGIGSILLLAIAYAIGVRIAWRRYRRNPYVMFFVIGSAAYFGVVALRFAPAAWETANRSSAFLYIGLAFVVALVGVARVRSRPTLWRCVATASFAVIFAGGVIAGWSPDARLSRPYEVAADSRTIEPEGLAIARWAAKYLGPNRRYAASESDARFLLVYADAFVLAGRNPDVQDVIQTPTLPDWQLELLRQHGLRYVVVDLRVRSFDNTVGYYFGLSGKAHADELFSVDVARKFDRIHANKIYDSGTIIVYDMGPNYESSAQR
jgi:hypothetical protein